MPVARVEQYHGEPAIMIDGKPYPPMTMTVYPGKHSYTEMKEYLRDLGEAGMKIFYLETYTRWNQPGNPAEGIPDGITKTISDMDALLEAVPDAYVILRLIVAPPASWVNAHPEEMVRFSDGSTRQCICTTVGREILDGMHSLCSEAWRQEGAKVIEEYLDELKTTPHFDRVIGFFLCAGGTGEWYYPQKLIQKDGAYGDFSEPFRKEFSRFLREKYGTEEELRRVWQRPDATFEHPIIPTVEEREYAFAIDKKIAHSLREWETVGYAIGANVDVDAREPANLGVFLNANGYANVADFYDAWHEATARTVVHFARVLKSRYPDLLVGAFYGSYGCTEYFDDSTAGGTLTVLDSGAVDFLASPDTYNNREPGGAAAQRQMQDSLRLRGKLYVCENDTRTQRTEPWIQRDSMAIYTVEDAITILKRDFARDLCEDVQGWWFDMGCNWPGGGNWYNDPDILALFARQQEIAQYAYSLDRTKKNDIALIFDAESLHYVSGETTRMVVDYYRTSDLGRIGAPVDYYFHNDMSRPDMPDYKMYVMLNQYYLSDAEREAIREKARRNHALVLWLYAPGFINPNAPSVMDIANIEKTVGMKVGLIDRTIFPHFRVDPESHPALKLTSAGRRYGVIDRDVHSNIWIERSTLPPVFANPGFYIDDPDAVILGRYCHNGQPAMALTEKDGYTSVYCAAQVLRSDMLASLASYAGCHLFLHSDDILFANENFVCIHAKDDGKRTVYFKRPCSPFEVYEKTYYGHDVDHIELDMKLGETKMWSLSGSF